jgi:hypothetical protein
VLWRGESGADLQKRWLQDRSGRVSIAILSRLSCMPTRPGADLAVGGRATRRRGPPLEDLVQLSLMATFLSPPVVDLVQYGKRLPDLRARTRELRVDRSAALVFPVKLRVLNRGVPLSAGGLDLG